MLALADVADPQGGRIAGPKFAVDAQIEESKLAGPLLHLQTNRIAQISLGLNGAFWPTSLPLFQGARGVVIVLIASMMITFA